MFASFVFIELMRLLLLQLQEHYTQGMHLVANACSLIWPKAS